MNTSFNEPSNSDNPGESLRKTAGRGIFWSVIKSWLSKFFTVFLSIFLARLLSPEEFGIAAASALVLMLVPMFAEFGFGDSIMQRQNLKSIDVNLPFIFASAFTVLMVTLVIWMRIPISAWVGLGDRTEYLVAITATVLVAVPTVFQEAMYKRNMRFKDLAMRSIASNIMGGIAALLTALTGFGIWTFVVQAYVSLIVNVVWIWWRPIWLPGLKFEVRSFFEMIRFGAPVQAQRLIDFVGTRTLDFVIIGQIGIVAYGFYVVGSRLYQTMMQLMQSAIYDISLTLLSTVAHDIYRIRKIYLKTISISIGLMSPVFVMLATIAPEMCLILFGVQWKGADVVAGPMLLLGAVQCVQYMNGSFLAARGRTELVLITGVTRSILQVLAVLLLSTNNLEQMTWVFVVASLMAAPLSFAVVAHELGLSLVKVATVLICPAIISSITFFTITYIRTLLKDWNLGVFLQGCLLASGFVFFYVILLSFFDRPSFNLLYNRFDHVRIKLASKIFD